MTESLGQRRSSVAGPDAELTRSDDGSDPFLQRSQARTQDLRKNPGSGRDAEPHRGSEGSYDQFLMVDEPKAAALDEGLQAVFKSVFPISDFSGSAMLEFVSYEFERRSTTLRNAASAI
jgi:DNA-directed RNA polymerase beta subunit